MKTYLTFMAIGVALILLSIIHTFAKNNPESKEVGPDGVVTGLVFNEATKEPVAFANVSLMRQQDSSIVTGAITNEQGVFTIDKVPAGDYRVAVKFIGFKKNLPLSNYFFIVENSIKTSLSSNCFNFMQ